MSDNFSFDRTFFGSYVVMVEEFFPNSSECVKRRATLDDVEEMVKRIESLKSAWRELQEIKSEHPELFI